MSVSGISSSSSFINQNIATLQNQQQRAQEFQSLALEFQSGGSAQAQPAETSTQPTPLQELAQPTSATPAKSAASPATPADPTSGPASTPNSHLHWHHRLRLPVGSNADSNQSAPTPWFGQLSQPVQSAAAPTAQPGYSLQQALQQIALNSDLLTAQSAALQASALSVSA